MIAFAAATAATMAVAEEETVIFDAPAEAATSEGSAASLFVSGGYASDYIFRGRNFGDNLLEGRADLAVAVASNTTLSAGGKYAGTDDYEEAQAFASLQQGFGAFTAMLGYRWYGLDADDRQEVGCMLGTSLVGIDWNLGYFYDTELSGHYVEFFGQHDWELMDHVSLRTAAGISGVSNYWYGSSGFNNVVFRLDLPVDVKEWITVTPWISASVPMDAISDFEDDAVYGGVNLQLSF